MSNVEILPVIMYGGAGTRLWPLSVPAAPKPLHRFGAEHTLFQQTVLRNAPVYGFQPSMVVCSADHLGLVDAELAEIGVEPLPVPVAALVLPKSRAQKGIVESLQRAKADEEKPA